MRLAGPLVMLAVSLLASGAAAGPRYEVNARLAAGGKEVAIEERVEVAEEGPWQLWFYADRARHRPPSFDEFSADRLFVGGDDRGGFGESEVEVEGCETVRVAASDQAGSDAIRGRLVPLSICESARRPLRIRLRTTLSLARRLGTLGRGSDTVSLGDPWYPLLVRPGAPGPPAARHQIALTTAEEALLVGPGEARRGQSMDAHIEGASHAPVFILEGGHVAIERARGVEIRVVTRRAPMARGGAQDPVREGDFFDPDAARRIQGAVRGGVSALARLGFAGPGENGENEGGEAGGRESRVRGLPARLVVVEINERVRLAVGLPGVVAVSDRAFRVLQVDAVQRFHRVEVERQILGGLLAPGRVAAGEAAGDEGWTADALGSALAEGSLEPVAPQVEGAAALLGPLAFLPSIDQLLYAPEVPFGAAYFRELRAHDPDRDGAWRALNRRPEGRFLLEKMRDRLGPDGVRRVLVAALTRGETLRRALEAETGASEGWFFSQWLAGPRRLAYRLAGVSSVLSVNGYHHTVRVERLGDVAVREPVQIEVEDRDGHVARGVWDEAGASGVVTLRTPGELRDARVDPDRRLDQDPSFSLNHPAHDDRIEHELRPPILSNVVLSASLGEARPTLDVEALIKQRYDVRSAIGVRAAVNPRGALGSLRHVFGLGPMKDLNSTIYSVSPGVTGLRSRAGFGGAGEPVTTASASLGFALDTRRQRYNPRTGAAFSLTAALGAARPDGGNPGAVASLTARGQLLFWPEVRHVLALTGGAAVVRCPSLPQSLPALSGRQFFRGYEEDELLGCATAYAVLEERWAIVKGPYVSNAGLSWSHTLELVPFVGAGLLSSQRRVTDLRPVLDAGLGLRVHYDNFGIAPAILTLDVGFPISRTDPCGERAPDGSCARRRLPVGLYASFEQTL
jgi:hypothetical protein